MYLQTAAHSVSNIHLQSIQTYHGQNPVPVDSKLDAITEQIVNTQDAALKALEQIEDGSAKRMWEAQKSTPSATWIGDLMDRLFGWGKYYSSKQEPMALTSSAIKRTVLDIDMCSYNTSNDDVIDGDLYTSFEVQNHPNGSCSLLDPEIYRPQLFQWVFRPILGPDDIICRIGNCIRNRLLECYPNCLPCQNATEDEKNNMLNTSHSILLYRCEYEVEMYWVYLIHPRKQNNQSNINVWKQTQIVKLFNATRFDCENQILHPPVQANSNALYSLLAIPVAIMGGVFYVLYRRGPKSTVYEQL